MMKTITLIICLILGMVFSVSAPDKKINVLLFSRTMDCRHNSISTGLKMMSDLAQERNRVLTAIENADLFTSEFLKTFNVVLFLNPTQDLLNEQQQKNFEAFMAGGKGFMGIHAGGGASEIIQSPDSETPWDMAESAMGLFEMTGEPEWLEIARNAVYMLSTWTVSYDYKFPPDTGGQVREF